jgi:hypothetical protein
VVTGAVRVIECLLVAALGFAIYLGYVESEGKAPISSISRRC